MIIENATIQSVFIGRESHGMLTMVIELKGRGWAVGFGGYMLDKYDDAKKTRVGQAMLAQAVLDLMDVFEVNDIAQLKGLPCRVEMEGVDGGKTSRIAHFLDDRWFSFAALADRNVTTVS